MDNEIGRRVRQINKRLNHTETQDAFSSSGAPPTGAAGGDLTGTYPNPTLAAGSVDLASVKVTGILPPDKGGTGINNGARTLTIGTNSGTLNFTGIGKTLSIANSLSLLGTDGKALNLGGNLVIGADTTISGGGTLALGGFTGTLPATGTFALGTGVAGRVSYWSDTNTLTSSGNLRFDGNALLIGVGFGLTGVGDLYISGNQQVAGTIGVGPTPSATRGISVLKTFTDPATTTYGISVTPISEITATNGNFLVAGYFDAIASPAAGTTFTSGTSMRGVQASVTNQGPGTVTTAAAILTQIVVSGGVMTTGYNINILAPSTSGGTIGTLYGLHVNAMTAGSTNYAIYTAGGETRHLAGSSTVTPLVLMGAASQSASLQEWQDSGGTVLASVGPEGTLGVGAAAVSTIGLRISKGFTDTTTSNIGISLSVTQAVSGVSLTVGSFISTWTSTTGNISTLAGINVTPTIGAAATSSVTTLRAIFARVDNSSTGASTAVNGYGVYIANPGGAGAITNNYGLIVENMTRGGTLNYAILTQGGETRHMAGTSTVIPLVVMGAASQSVSLQEWRSSTGTVLASVSSGGRVGIGLGSTSPEHPLHVQSSTAATGILVSGQQPSIVARMERTTGGAASWFFEGILKNTASGLSTTGVRIGILGNAQADPTAPTIDYLWITANPQTDTTPHIGAPFRMTPAGRVGIGLSGTTVPAARFHVQGVDNIVQQIVQGFSTQTASIQEWRNSAGTALVKVPGLGGLVIGSAALATTATDGFLYLPTCAGTPTGTPAAQTGTVAALYDTTANKLWVYNGAWRSVTLA